MSLTAVVKGRGSGRLVVRRIDLAQAVPTCVDVEMVSRGSMISQKPVRNE
jgi:hypothetical protein